MKSKQVMTGILALSFSLAFLKVHPAFAQDPIDCTNRTQRVYAGKLKHDYISHGGSVECLEFLGGGTLNGNGHTIICDGECEKAAIVIRDINNKNTTVQAVTVEGHWGIGIETEDQLPTKKVTIQKSTFRGIKSFGVVGGTVVSQNVFEGGEDDFVGVPYVPGTAIVLWTGSNLAQRIQDNWIDLEQGAGILLISAAEGDAGVTLAENHLKLDPADNAAAYFVYSNATVPVTMKKNIFMLGNSTVNQNIPPFQIPSMMTLTNNICDQALRRIDTSEICEAPVAPFGFNPAWSSTAE